MNVAVYIFGKLGGDYTQYPDDHARDIFSKFENNIKSPSQLMIHRHDALIYYGYLRKLSEPEKYVGIAFVFNDAMCCDIKALCKLYEDNITNWVINGEILEFADNGEIISNVDKLYKTASEIRRLSESLSIQIESIKLPFTKLPPVNYAVSADAVKKFSIEEGNDTFNKAIKDYSNIYIYSGSTSDTLVSYSDKLRRLYNENIRLKDENTKLTREKKQIKVIVWLLIVMVVGIGVFFMAIKSKKDTIFTLQRDKTKLIQHVYELQSDSLRLEQYLSSTRYILNNKINRLQKDSLNLTKKNDSLQKICSNLRLEIDELQSGNSNSYSYNTSYTSTSSRTRNETYTTGSSLRRNIDGYDNNYALWVYAKFSLKINHFYVYPNKSGYITIGLYNTLGILVSSYSVYVQARQWKEVFPNFKLIGGQKYYLAIKEDDGVGLGYHKSNENEYKIYKSGSLEILGTSQSGFINYNTDYYQYFYDINYTVL